jgi:hypothetical protein
MTERPRIIPQSDVSGAPKVDAEKKSPYQSAVENLRAVVGTNTEQVSSAGDLQRFLTGIPQSLVIIAETTKRRTVAHTARRDVYENFAYLGASSDGSQFITTDIDTPYHHYSVHLYWDREKIRISKHSMENDEWKTFYSVDVPRTINQSRNPIVALAKARAEAEGIDARPGENDTRETHQDYIPIFKEGVRDLSLILPPK